MSTIVTRSGKGSPLTHTEVDDNFTNLNTDKYQEGSAIGAVTPAAGTFTTLTATGQTSLGGVAGSESLRVTTTASAANYVQAQGNTTGNAPIVSAQGSDSNITLRVASKGTNGISFSTNFSGAGTGNTQAIVSHTESAVNYVQVTGAATTASPVISAQGSDTNVSLSFNQKGSGNLNFQTSGVTRHRVNGADGSVDSGLSSSGGISLKSLPVSNQVNYLQAAGNATGLAVQFSAQGSDTNISMAFQSKGTGAFQFRTNAGAQEQLRVSHTASAVNYVQVTGAATGNPPTISSQGSDSTIAMLFVAKGGQDHRFFSNTGSAEQFRVLHTAGTMANHGYATGAAAGASPVFGVRGTDTNIDLALTPKGTGATVANGNFKMNSGYGSAAIAYGCRAWVNFNGTGTVAISGSGNVSSITDNGTGDYTVNFTTEMPDANYSSFVNAGLGNSAVGWMIGFPNTKGVSNYTQTPTTTAMRFVLSYDAKATGLDDAAYVNVSIFR